MYFGTALVAALATSASAFLLPPSVSDVIKDTRFEEAPQHFKDLIQSLVADAPEIVDVKCRSCPPAFLKDKAHGGLATWSLDARAIVSVYLTEFTTC